MKRKIFLALVLVLAINLNTLCQNIPGMYIPKFISDHRISQFISGTNSKFSKVKQKLPNLTSSFIYTKEEIKILLSKIDTTDGLRVYFAVYNDCTNYPLPSTVKKNKIILLFSPGYVNDKPRTEQFFFIDENDNKDSVYEIIDMNCVQQWINNYKSDAIQNILRNTLVSNDPDNEDPNLPSKYFDTKSIFYPKDLLNEAITLEETYPHILKNGQKVNIEYFEFSISAFDNIGQFPPDPAGHKWRNRLLLNIDYMYKTIVPKKVLYLENLVNFDDRWNQTLMARFNLSKEKLEKLSKSKKLKLWMFGLDNGQLCPTNCPR